MLDPRDRLDLRDGFHIVGFVLSMVVWSLVSSRGATYLSGGSTLLFALLIFCKRD